MQSMSGPKVKDFLKATPEKLLYQVRVSGDLLAAVRAEAEAQGVSLTDLQEALFLFWLAESGKPLTRK